MKSCYKCDSHDTVRRIELPNGFRPDGWSKQPTLGRYGKVAWLCKECRSDMI